MSKVLYELFLADTCQLARTLVVKSVISVDTINKRIEGIGRTVDYNDPKSWKYYLNLAGEYHELDEPMSVKSLDTLTEIEFTKENLLVHRATAKAYAYGTPYYQALVSKFPKQEQLINGVLNPVDLDTAVKANDHAILWYDKTLVEANESNLITKLQEYVNAWWRINDSPAYEYAHDLYAGALQDTFYASLLGAILGIRLENCHTSNAHSFHIWSYLAGKGRLDEFQEYLTTKQTLWLYRNIDNLTSTLGQNSARDELVEHLFTERGFPVTSYDLYQSTEEMPEAITPQAVVVSNPLNFEEKTPQKRVTSEIRDLVEKELFLARENPLYSEEQIADIEAAVKYSNITNVPTRVLESKVVDRSESKHVRLPDVLLNHWVYLSQLRRYTAMLTVTDPQTGEAFNVSVKDAFVLWVWLMNRAQGWDLVKPPVVTAGRVRRPTIPTLADLKALVNPKYVPEWLLKRFYDQQPPIGLVVSTEAFNELCHEIYEGDLYQYKLCTDQQHYKSRVQTEFLNLAFYQDAAFELGPNGITYSQWFKERGLLFDSLGQYDALVLAGEILDKATGTDLSKQYTLKEIQTAMISLFTRLSSYTTQVIQSISSSPLVPMGYPITRIGDDQSKDVSHDHVPVNLSTVLDDRSKDVEVWDSSVFSGLKVTAQDYDRASVKLGSSLTITPVGPGKDKLRIKFPVMEFRSKE